MTGREGKGEGLWSVGGKGGNEVLLQRVGGGGEEEKGYDVWDAVVNEDREKELEEKGSERTHKHVLEAAKVVHLPKVRSRSSRISLMSTADETFRITHGRHPRLFVLIPSSPPLPPVPVPSPSRTPDNLTTPPKRPIKNYLTPLWSTIPPSKRGKNESKRLSRITVGEVRKNSGKQRKKKSVRARSQMSTRRISMEWTETRPRIWRRRRRDYRRGRLDSNVRGHFDRKSSFGLWPLGKR